MCRCEVRGLCRERGLCSGSSGILGDLSAQRMAQGLAGVGPQREGVPEVVEEKGVDTLESSEVEMAAASKAEVGKPSLSALKAQMEAMESLWASKEEQEESGSGYSDSEASAPRMLKPGGSRKPATKSRSKSSQSDDLVKQLMIKGLAEGQSTADLMPLLMMSMLAKDKGKRRAHSRGDSSGGSSSDSESEGKRHGGLKAVSSLTRMQKRIVSHPKKIVKEFERDAVTELGVVAGQAWTLRDFVRRQHWGKFKGVYRCAMMDVAVYEQLRAGQHDIAQAQLAQNLKAKMQSVLQQGDWTSAWLLTGLPDPLARKEFAGSKEEMSVISGYVAALAKLKKQVKEAEQMAGGDEEEGEASSSKKK